MPEKIKNFKWRHKLSNEQISKIVCVAPNTVRKYLAHPGAASHRAVNPTVNKLLDYIDENNIDIELPAIQAFVKYEPLEFKAARGDHGVQRVAIILDVDRATVHRWEVIDDYYEPSGPASKMLYIMNIFGWPAD